ncbi:hypothetical protein [Methanocaldococcus sp.]
MRRLIFLLLIILIPSLILASNVYLDIVPKECEVGNNVYLIIKLSKDVKEFKAKIESKDIYFPISYIDLVNDTDKVVIGKAINNGLGEINITAYIKGDNSTVIKYYTFKINIYTAKKVEEKTILKNVSKTNNITNITNNNSNTKINLTRINLNSKAKNVSKIKNNGSINNNSQIIDNNPEGVGNYIFYGILGLISGVIFGYTLTYIINIK